MRVQRGIVSLAFTDLDESITSVQWKKDHHFIKLFCAELSRLVSGKNLESNELKVIFDLLPYLEYETNCFINSDNMPMSKQDICNVLSYSENTVDDILKSLRRKEVIANSKLGRKNQYFLNPCLFFKGKKIDKTLYMLFKNYIKKNDYTLYIQYADKYGW